jgi:DNA-binding response OmpR family regulator
MPLVYTESEDKMRVIVFGREKTGQRLTAILAEEGIETVSLSDGLGKLMALWKRGAFDMAIVDSLAGEAEAACHHINESWAIPLMLVADMKNADWQRLRSLRPDGYLPEEAEDDELRAHLRATLRRLSLDKQVENLKQKKRT